MKNIIVGLTAFAVGFFALGPAYSALTTKPPVTHTITFDPGGVLVERYEGFAKMRNEGVHIRIDGFCISACTMVAGLIPDDQVCITPYAKLAFHAAFTIDILGERRFSPEGTEFLWHIYPEKVRALLRAKGWESPDVDQPTLIIIDGEDLKNVFRLCNKE